MCNCFLSENTLALAPTSVFHPATAGGPAGVFGELDEHAQAAIESYITGKKDRVAHERREHGDVSCGLYQPLMSGETRVLELFPAQLDTPLQGALHIVSVDFAHPSQDEGGGRTYTRHTNHAISLKTEKPFWYTALSYVWGPPRFDEVFQLDHGLIKITSSLASVLHRLKSSQHSIYLWVDQICVNQLDNREKEQQIPLMGEIYTKATNTIIWLGDENDENPGLAFETMEAVHARLQLSDVEITPDDFSRLDFPPANDQSWTAIRQLFRRPWFSRLWTIQEAINSRNLYIKCGNAVVCWDDLAAWCYVLEHCSLLRWLKTTDNSVNQRPDNTNYNPLQLSSGTIINSLQADRVQNLVLEGKEYLLNSLVRTRYAQATEPKDKVYGVLGITESSIKPDYSSQRTVRSVYHEACLTQMPHLIYEILSCVDHDQPLRPSWVPDWNAARVTESLGYSTKAWTLYQAGGRLVPGQTMFKDYNASTLMSDGDQKVTLNGVFFDKIEHLGHINENPTLDINAPKVENQPWASYVELIDKHYMSNEYVNSRVSIYDAFWNTLLAGRDESGMAAPTQDHSEVFSLILDATTGKMPSLPGQTYSQRRQKGFYTLKSLRNRRPAECLDDLRTAFRSAMTMRRFAISRKGYFALVPRGAREGDEIVIFKRACVPFVIRKTLDAISEGYGYELLGEAYVHGIMRGEVMEMADVCLEDVTLI